MAMVVVCLLACTKRQQQTQKQRFEITEAFVKYQEIKKVVCTSGGSGSPYQRYTDNDAEDSRPVRREASREGTGRGKVALTGRLERDLDRIIDNNSAPVGYGHSIVWASLRTRLTRVQTAEGNCRRDR